MSLVVEDGRLASVPVGWVLGRKVRELQSQFLARTNCIRMQGFSISDTEKVGGCLFSIVHPMCWVLWNKGQNHGGVKAATIWCLDDDEAVVDFSEVLS